MRILKIVHKKECRKVKKIDDLLIKDLEKAFKLGNKLAQKKSFAKKDSRKLLCQLRYKKIKGV